MAQRKGYRKHTKEECIKDAQKYTMRTEWHKASNALYMAAYTYGWLEECCKHMVPSWNYTTQMTRNKVLAIAHRYDSLYAFRYGAPDIYRIAERRGWLNECVG